MAFYKLHFYFFVRLFMFYLLQGRKLFKYIVKILRSCKLSRLMRFDLQMREYNDSTATVD